MVWFGLCGASDLGGRRAASRWSRRRWGRERAAVGHVGAPGGCGQARRRREPLPGDVRAPAPLHGPAAPAYGVTVTPAVVWPPSALVYLWLGLWLSMVVLWV